MDSVLLESPTTPNSDHNNHRLLSPLPAFHYDSLLRETADRFISDIRRGTAAVDFAGYRVVSLRLLSSFPDPPLESIWLHAAVTFISQSNGSDSIAGISELFQFLVSCTATSAGAKSVAVIAPVISELYKLLARNSTNEKVKGEAELLLERILGYISICCSNWNTEADNSAQLLACFFDVSKIWIKEDQNGIASLFPMLNEEIRSRLFEAKDGLRIGSVAGVVIAEAFLMKICLKARSDLRKELRIWAVSSVTVFRDQIFFEILLRLLLAPALPVGRLLDQKDENIVRDVLYDALILVDYSFLNPGIESEQSYYSLARIAVLRLIVTHQAIQIARSRGDHTQAVSYTNAFSTSNLPQFLIKWIMNKAGLGINKPNATTPEVLFKWLVSHEGALRLLGGDILELCSKLSFNEPKGGVLADDSETMRLDATDFIFDKQGDVAENTVREMKFIDDAAAQSMKIAGKGRRKRGEHNGEGQKRAKYVEYKIVDNPMKDSLSLSVADGTGSGSEVENPDSDDEMEDVRR